MYKSFLLDSSCFPFSQHKYTTSHDLKKSDLTEKFSQEIRVSDPCYSTEEKDNKIDGVIVRKFQIVSQEDVNVCVIEGFSVGNL